MRYVNKQALIGTIRKTADMLVKEYRSIAEEDRGVRLGSGGITLHESLAYQIGWMNLIQSWDRDERAGKRVELPSSGVQWNQLGPLYIRFYASYRKYKMQELQILFSETVEELCWWLDTFEEEDLLLPGGRKWAASTPSDGTVGSWVHTSTVASFKACTEKIQKWKRTCEMEARNDRQNRMSANKKGGWYTLIK